MPIFRRNLPEEICNKTHIYKSLLDLQGIVLARETECKWVVNMCFAADMLLPKIDQNRMKSDTVVTDIKGATFVLRRSIFSCFADLSRAMAASVLTEAPTATPWRYGAALQTVAPYHHSAARQRQHQRSLLNCDDDDDDDDDDDNYCH